MYLPSELIGDYQDHNTRVRVTPLHPVILRTLNDDDITPGVTICVTTEYQTNYKSDEFKLVLEIFILHLYL